MFGIKSQLCAVVGSKCENLTSVPGLGNIKKGENNFQKQGINTGHYYCYCCCYCYYYYYYYYYYYFL